VSEITLLDPQSTKHDCTARPEQEYFEDFYWGIRLAQPYLENGTRRLVDYCGTKISSLPSLLEASVDVELAARRVLTLHEFLVFRACFLDRRLEESEIPQKYLNRIRARCGEEFVRCGLCWPRVYFDWSRSFLEQRRRERRESERQERLKKASLRRMRTRDRVRAERREEKRLVLESNGTEKKS
jgi:hypothetical protein